VHNARKFADVCAGQLEQHHSRSPHQKCVEDNAPASCQGLVNDRISNYLAWLDKTPSRSLPKEVLRESANVLRSIGCFDLVQAPMNSNASRCAACEFLWLTSVNCKHSGSKHTRAATKARYTLPSRPQVRLVWEVHNRHSKCRPQQQRKQKVRVCNLERFEADSNMQTAMLNVDDVYVHDGSTRGRTS
jgi:hypothetical protein